MAAALCLEVSDRSFGPRVDINCRPLDFTLKFEDLMLACVPTAIFVFFLPLQIFRLLGEHAVCSWSHQCKLPIMKATIFASASMAQAVLLAFRVRNKRFQTDASLAADVLSLLAFVGALFLCCLDHQRSLRPSTLLTLFLSISILTDVVRVRTFWLVDDTQAEPMAMSIILGLSGLALLLECVPTLDANSAAKRGAPEQYSGFWNRTLFTWLGPLFSRGYRHILTIDDLPHMDTQLECHQLRRVLVETWAQYDFHGKHTLVQSCFRAFLRSFLSGVPPRLCQTVFTFLQPFLVSSTVQYISSTEADANYGKGLIGAWALVFLGIAVISTSVANYQTTRFTARIRGSLIGLICQQTVQIRTVESGDVTAVALLGADIERISLSFQMIHESWASLVDIGVAVWLLGRQMSVACIAPIVISILFMAIVSKISNSSKAFQIRWIEKVQDRLLVTTSILGDMKTVKMLGLVPVMSQIIQGLRQAEISVSSHFRKFLIVQLLLSITPSNVAPVVTFAIYAVVAVFWKDESLLASRAFTSITLIRLLTDPVLIYIQTIPPLVQCLGSFDRIQEYYNYSPLSDSTHHTLLPGQPGSSRDEFRCSNRNHPCKSSPRGYAFEFSGQDFAWKKQDRMILNHIDVKIEKSKITMIVGPVGAGKSTMLESILGETLSSSPIAPNRYTTKAYCAQQPWLENNTIRANIIGALPYEEAWYCQVKSYCNLTGDLQCMEKGDQTRIGSKGLNLSGGQRQRIALARAIYSKADVILLDDVFSGMDAHTVHAIFRQLLGPKGHFRANKKTVVMATHNHKLMTYADTVIVLEDGMITDSGTLKSLAQKDGYISRLGLAPDSEESSEDLVDTGHAVLEEERPELPVRDDEANGVNDDMRRQNGDLSVYKYYFASSGYESVACYAIFIVSWVFFTEFPTIWLKWWSEANATNPNRNIGLYVGVLAAFGIAGSLCICAACWFAFVSIISNSAHKMHADLLEAISNAPLHVFVTTNIGSLTNRLSQDLELIDMTLPIIMVNYTGTLVSLAAKGIILAVFSRYLAISIPVIGASVYFLQRFYLRTSRQVRLLEIEAKAPLYTHLIETTAGATTIRAFGWQKYYQRRSDSLIDDSQRPMYLQQCIQHWLRVMLNLMMTTLAVLLVSIIVRWKSKFDAGSVGVSLVMVITFGEVLARVITTWTSMESSIGAVARIKNFVNETAREENGCCGNLPERWPPIGGVEIKGLVACHTSSSVPVLKGITMSIKPGQHIAICGGSGSGKTSLVLTFLKMIEKTAGGIEVDGFEISKLSCSDVRSSLNVVPQDPFLLPGTVRFNIDPLETVSEDEVIRVLTRVTLWKDIQEQGGLDRNLNPQMLSTGQKQLLCLARAMIKQSKILILDEASSSVDSDTECIIQEVIDTEFKDCTVLAVMHRLGHVTKYDKLALLDNGFLIEFEEPATLLATKSRFAELYWTSLR